MLLKNYIQIILLAVMVMSCSDQVTILEDPVQEDAGAVVSITDTICQRAPFREEGYVYDIADRTYLWAGADSAWHFDITDWELNECNLLYGLGRETFPALLEPQYVSIDDFKTELGDVEKCLVLYSAEEVKVYPYEIMISYEVVNEVHRGEPIMIAYCVLADLGAIYTRDYCGSTLTFGVSGYTYYDEQIWGGLDAFLLWDRDTESLWWPLVDRAISGHLKGHTLEKYTESLWEIKTWREVQDLYPEALVLFSGQTQTIPDPYPWPDDSLFDCK